MRIFLVENHPDTLAYLGSYLRLGGHEVETARTLAGALRDLAMKPCDLLLTDLGLPDGDGWSLLARLGPARPRFAIAMSGRNTAEDRERSRAAGFQQHLIKPFLPDELDRALQALDGRDPA